MADKEGNGNGSKTARALMASGYILPCLVSAVLVWYITTKETPRRMDKTDVKIEAIEGKVEANKEDLNDHDVSIGVLQSELGNINKGIDRLEIAVGKIDRGHVHATTGRRRRPGP